MDEHCSHEAVARRHLTRAVVGTEARVATPAELQTPSDPERFVPPVEGQRRGRRDSGIIQSRRGVEQSGSSPGS